MLKVLMADDHYPVLELLSQTIPWKELGLEVIGQCGDGAEALEQCERQIPDILITDIGMPRVDGLELIERLQEQRAVPAVVILSCHDEFQYAQKAVRLGVQDYVLKESLEPEQMTELLRRLAGRIRKRHTSEQRKHKLERQAHQSSALMKAELIRGTISNPVADSNGWLAEMAEAGVDFSLHPYMPVLVYPNSLQHVKSKFQTADLFGYAFGNVVSELVDATEAGVSFRYSAREIIILFPFPKTIKYNQHERIRERLMALIDACRRYIGISVSAMTGESAAGHLPFKKNLQALLSAKDQRFYASGGSIYKWVPFQTIQEDIFASYQQAVDDFKRLIAEEKEEQTEIVVKEWMQYIHDRRFSVDSVISWTLKLLMDLEVKYSSLRHFTSSYSAELLHKQIVELETLQDMQAFVIDYVRGKIRLVNSLNRQSQRAEIYEAKKYVATHLHEKISMEEVATLLQMNSSHFSRIFKNETGETFVEYVTRMKMEQAGEMLEQSDKTIEQIAESLGYDNTSYFIKLFKSHYGCSPKDYRLR